MPPTAQAVGEPAGKEQAPEGRKKIGLRATPLQNPCPAGNLRDIHKRVPHDAMLSCIAIAGRITRKPALDAGSARNCDSRCTISGHAAVNGVHSIENTSSYKGVFSID